MRIRLTLILLLCMVCPAHGERRTLVGVYYFSGWWEEKPNKYMSRGQDWRASYPGRTPTLGEYNTQATMDREIVAASGHAVNFFQFLWYRPDTDRLNAGVRQFMASPNNEAMNFTIEYVNHPPFGIWSEKDWADACLTWCEYFKHPRYLRLDGRAVFKVHGLDYFRQQCGGKIDVVKQRLATLRKIALEQHAGELLIAGGVMAGAVVSKENAEPYDWLTTYMDMPALKPRQQPYPYEDLIEFARQAWRRYGEKSPRPYVPYIPAGWDPRPWHDPRPSFDPPLSDQWVKALRDVQRAMEVHPSLGIPLETGRQRMVLIYAWNEFGEGGIVAPTIGSDGVMLNGIQKVFGDDGR